MSVVPLDGSVVTVELFMPIGTASETSISISYVFFLPLKSKKKNQLFFFF